MDELKHAIKTLSGKYEVDPLSLRIKISRPKKELEYHIMQNAKTLDETNIATVLNMNPAKAFFANVKLTSAFKALSSNSGIDASRMNVRLYIKSLEESRLHVYLFDGTEPKQEVPIEDIEALF